MAGLCLLLVLSALSLSEGRVFSRCELRDMLRQKADLPRQAKNKPRVLARVICEVERLSSLDTGMVREYEKAVYDLSDSFASTTTSPNVTVPPFSTPPPIPPSIAPEEPIPGTSFPLVSPPPIPPSIAPEEPIPGTSFPLVSPPPIPPSIAPEELIPGTSFPLVSPPPIPPSIAPEEPIPGTSFPPVSSPQTIPPSAAPIPGTNFPVVTSPPRIPPSMAQEKPIPGKSSPLVSRPPTIPPSIAPIPGTSSPLVPPSPIPPSIAPARQRRKRSSVSVTSANYYGIFQFSDRKYCHSGYHSTKDQCHSDCNAFLDDDISDDLECFVHSDMFWDVYRRASRFCKSRKTQRSFFDGCDGEEEVLTVDRVVARVYVSGGSYK